MGWTDQNKYFTFLYELCNGWLSGQHCKLAVVRTRVQLQSKPTVFFLEFIVVLNEILMLNEIQLFEMKLQFFWGVPMIIIIIIYLSL